MFFINFTSKFIYLYLVNKGINQTFVGASIPQIMLFMIAAAANAA